MPILPIPFVNLAKEVIFTKYLTNRNFDRSVIRSRYAAVLFCANCCGPSRMARESFRSVSKTRKNVGFFTVDIDAEELLAKRCGVEVIPAVLFFADGEPLLVRYGISGKKSLEDTLDRLTK